MTILVMNKPHITKDKRNYPQMQNKKVIELTRPGLSGRVATGSTGVLLDVKRATTTSLAESVRLVVTLTETGGTLC